MKLNTDSNSSGFFYIIFAAILWGTTGTAQEFAPAGANPMTVGTIRLAIGGFVLMALAVYRKQFSPREKWSISTTAISAFFVASYQLCFFAAVAKTGVAVGTMVAIGSSPIAAGILGFLIRKETLSRKWYLATFCAILGCTLLSISGGQLNLDLIGIALALGAGFSYAMYTVCIKGLLETHLPDAVMAVVFSCAAILLLPTLFLSDSSWLLQPRGFAVALHLGIVTAALSYWLFARGLKTVSVGNVATLSLAEPLTATLLGVFVLGEYLSSQELVGILLIFTGIVVLSIPSFKQKRAV